MLTRRILPFLAAPAFARAPWAPDRAICIVAPFAPGGPSDLIARIMAEACRRTTCPLLAS